MVRKSKWAVRARGARKLMKAQAGVWGGGGSGRD